MSNANAYVASLFRTLKSVLQWPSSGFNTVEEARQWVEKLTHWYNNEHRHRGIGYITPQRHSSEEVLLLAQRDKLYQVARVQRWSGKTQNWKRQETVMLNPEREKQLA